MKRNLSVPQLDQYHIDASYTTLVDYDEATEAGADELEAVKVGRYYYYLADEAGEVFRLTRREVAEYGAGLLDGRGVDYSLWCSTTGSIVKRPSGGVCEALGITDH